MKSKVKLSLLSASLTIIVIALFIIGLISTREIESKFIPLCVILAGMVGFSLFYSPLSIETTDDSLIIHRWMKKKRIPFSSIAKAERCYPSGGGLRLCGSGGFMGYWGYFHDIIIGAYFGYYGNRDQCILIQLNNGRRYVISCEYPDEMLESIKVKS